MAEDNPSRFRVKLVPNTASRAECDVTVPYDVDRARNVSLPALLRLFELSRGAAAFELDWGALGTLFKSTPWLLKAQETLIDTEAGRKLIPQASAVIQMEISALGQRSFVIQSTLIDAVSRKQLMLHRCSCICTHLDAETGRRASAFLPEWFHKTHQATGQSSAGDEGAWPARLAPEQGSSLWTGHVEVRASDTDVNGHVNNVVYATYVLDAIADASRQGLLPELGDDAAGNRIRASQVQYDGEAHWGDSLQVDLYRRRLCQKTRRLTIGFNIRRPRTGQKPLTLGTVTFIVQQASSRL